MAALLAAYSFTLASSHREAPLISKDPYADTTDVYAFVPQGVTDTVVLVASWIPFEGPEGGPNYYEWDDTVLYDIFVSNDGDPAPEITYTLSSKVQLLNPNTFLYNTGPITSLNDPDWNRRQVYTLTETLDLGPQVTQLVAGALAPPVNIGSKSTPDYASLATEATYTYTDPGNGDQVKVFAGQTDDAFWVDLQSLDLLTLRGQSPPVGYTIGNNDPIELALRLQRPQHGVGDSYRPAG